MGGRSKIANVFFGPIFTLLTSQKIKISKHFFKSRQFSSCRRKIYIIKLLSINNFVICVPPPSRFPLATYRYNLHTHDII